MIVYDQGRNLATAAAEGRFRFDRLPPATVRFDVRAYGHADPDPPVIMILAAGARIEDVELVVEPYATASRSLAAWPSKTGCWPTPGCS